MTARPRPKRTPRLPAVAPELADRVPPGQIVTPRWPVLHQGDVPTFDPETWELRVWGCVRTPVRWSWAEFQHLPETTSAGDLHCVTRWSTLDHQWTGVAAGTILGLVDPLPEARAVMLHAGSGYSANITLEVFAAADTLLATRHNGAPLTPEHGGPLRAVLPGLYAWKSVKWLRGIEFVAEERPGFWEGYGYHNAGDVWREERFES